MTGEATTNVVDVQKYQALCESLHRTLVLEQQIRQATGLTREDQVVRNNARGFEDQWAHAMDTTIQSMGQIPADLFSASLLIYICDFTNLSFTEHHPYPRTLSDYEGFRFLQDGIYAVYSELNLSDSNIAVWDEFFHTLHKPNNWMDHLLMAKLKLQL